MKRMYRFITPDMIGHVLVRKAELKIPPKNLRKCIPHQRSGCDVVRPCKLVPTRNSVKALILDPNGLIEVTNQEYVCGTLKSKPFYAMGEEVGTKSHRTKPYRDRPDMNVVAPYVDVPVWNGTLQRKQVFEMNKWCGVTKNLMRWCSNLGFSHPEAFTPCMYRFSSLFRDLL